MQTHDLGAEQCAIVTISVEGRSADDVATALAEQGINVSTTVAEHNHFDTEQRDVHPLVRLSPHYFNLETELSTASAAIAAISRL